MENLTLIASSESPYCQSVKGQLLAAGLLHTTEILTWEALRASPRVRARSPKGQVPVLEHAAGVCVDSLLIAVQICEAASRRASAHPTAEPHVPTAYTAGGLAWLASQDALVFRTAEVELRDGLMEVYRLRMPPDALLSKRLAEASAMALELLETSSLARVPPEPTPGCLHAAFLVNALLGLLEKRGCGVPAETSHLAAVLSEVPLVAQVLLFFGQRNHMLPTGGAS